MSHKINNIQLETRITVCRSSTSSDLTTSRSSTALAGPQFILVYNKQNLEARYDGRIPVVQCNAVGRCLIKCKYNVY